MNGTREQLARVAFEAYGRSTGGKTYDGRPIPAWPELPERIREAWGCAVDAVLDEPISRAPVSA